jgi:hypothetical protein
VHKHDVFELRVHAKPALKPVLTRTEHRAGSLPGIVLSAGHGQIIATLYQVTAEWLALDEAGFSESALNRLALKEGDAQVSLLY